MESDFAEVKTLVTLIKSEFKNGVDLLSQRVDFLERRLESLERTKD